MVLGKNDLRERGDPGQDLYIIWVLTLFGCDAILIFFVLAHFSDVLDHILDDLVVYDYFLRLLWR